MRNRNDWRVVGVSLLLCVGMLFCTACMEERMAGELSNVPVQQTNEAGTEQVEQAIEIARENGPQENEVVPDTNDGIAIENTEKSETNDFEFESSEDSTSETPGFKDNWGVTLTATSVTLGSYFSKQRENDRTSFSAVTRPGTAR